MPIEGYPRYWPIDSLARPKKFACCGTSGYYRRVAINDRFIWAFVDDFQFDKIEDAV